MQNSEIKMRIAVEGCAHGELEIIYDTLVEIEKNDGKKIDLLICCGDFQSTRNLCDLKCMAVPDKYRAMCSFYKYYSGKKIAPVLTIFIGGNHEASNYLQELPYGGWVAPNIYYLGLAGVINIGNIRIAGISGIYKGQDWLQGHFEKPPYNANTLRSVFHVRNLEVFRLKQLSGKIDIFLSHDWPEGITRYGNEKDLLKRKPFFRNDIEENNLGSPANMDLLKKHYPIYWFAAHLHCKFAALVREEGSSRSTKFLALDKCLPRRKFLQILEVEHDVNVPIKISYDLEWLTILSLTNHLLSVKSGMHMMPGLGDTVRWMYTPTEEEKQIVFKGMNGDLLVPMNFIKTVEAYDPHSTPRKAEVPSLRRNVQTTEFCDKLGIDDPVALLQVLNGIKDVDNDVNLSKSDVYTSISKESETSTSESLDQTFESTYSSIEEEDTSWQSSLKTQSFSNLSIYSSTPLKLPPVKHDISSAESLDESPSKVIIEKIEKVEDEESLQPDVKKFKRRNQSIYSS